MGLDDATRWALAAAGAIVMTAAILTATAIAMGMQ